MIRAGVLFLVLGLWLAGCASATPAPSPTPVALQGAGPAVIAPAWPELAHAFTRRQPGVMLSLELLPSSTVLEEVANGQLDFGFSVDASARQRYPTLSFTALGEDALAIVVHAGVDLAEVSLAQLRDLFGGYVQSWAAVGGPELPVRLVSRPEGSGARVLFDDAVMAGRQVALTALVKPDDQTVVSYIARQPGAIGYASLVAVDDSVRVLSIDGIPPGAPAYPLNLAIDLVLPATPHPTAAALRAWLLAEGIGRFER